MSSEVVKIYSILPHKITGCYFHPRNPTEGSFETFEKYEQWKNDPNRIDNLKNNKHKGTLSTTAKGKISAAIHTLRIISNLKTVYVADTKKYWKFRLVFITLTLPAKQQHEDSEIVKRCLRPMIEWLEYNFKMNSYVWKAEVQGNGNIHFHLTTNVFIHYLKVRNKWNSLINALGYIDQFETTHGHRDAPSTQIKSVNNDKSIAGYIAGEVAKKDKVKKYCSRVISIEGNKYHKFNFRWEQQEDNSWIELKRPITSRLWGCSYNLTKMKIRFTWNNEKWVDDLRKVTRDDVWKIYNHDYGFCYFLKFNAWKKFQGRLGRLWNIKLHQCKNYEPKQRKYITESVSRNNKKISLN